MSATGAAPARLWEDRCPVAAELERAAPSPALAELVAGLEPTALGEEDLLEAIAACERMSSWLAAQQARFVNALADVARGSEVDLVPDQIAVRLATTRRAAQSTVELAASLRALPALAAALELGRVSPRKAQVLVRDTEHLPDQVAATLLDTVLPGAEDRTAPQLRRDLRAAELALDAGAADRRHRAARRDRCVWLTPGPDAMAWVHAFLPAADAVAVMTAVDAVADRHEPGEQRTVDQRRADALTALARRVLDTGTDPEGLPLTIRQHRRPHLEITVSRETLESAGWSVGRGGTLESIPSDRTGGGPAHLGGYGPVPWAAVAGLVGEARPTLLAVDPEGSPVAHAGPTDGYRPSAELVREVLERDRTCRFPGCGVPAARCDIDHIAPFDPDRPARWQTTAANLHALCRHHHRVKTFGGWSVSRDRRSGATLWRAPTGDVRIVGPEPLVPPDGRATGPPPPPPDEEPDA